MSAAISGRSAMASTIASSIADVSMSTLTTTKSSGDAYGVEDVTRRKILISAQAATWRGSFCVADLELALAVEPRELRRGRPVLTPSSGNAPKNFLICHTAAGL